MCESYLGDGAAARRGISESGPATFQPLPPDVPYSCPTMHRKDFVQVTMADAVRRGDRRHREIVAKKIVLDMAAYA